MSGPSPRNSQYISDFFGACGNINAANCWLSLIAWRFPAAVNTAFAGGVIPDQPPGISPEIECRDTTRGSTVRHHNKCRNKECPNALIGRHKRIIHYKH
jgi:hypothetical protein